MKKILALIMAVIMAASLVACGDETGTEAENAETGNGGEQVDEELTYTSDGRIKLSWWTNYGTVIYETLMELCNRYNESQDKYYIQCERQGGAIELKAKLQASSRSNLPDVFNGTPATTLYYVNSSFTKPIQDYIDEDADNWTADLYGGIRTSYSDADGKMWGYPFGVSTTGIWVNADLLERAGYTANDLNGFENIVKVAKALVDDGYVQYGLGFYKNGQLLTDVLSVQGVQVVDNDNGYSGEPEKCLYIDEPDTYAATYKYLDLFASLYRDKPYAMSYGSDVNGEIVPQFVAEKCAMFIATNSYVGKLETMNIDFNYIFIPTTGVDENAKFSGALSEGTGMYMADTGSPTRMQGAYDFIKFLAQDENQALYCMATGYIPYTPSCADRDDFKAWVAETFPSSTLISDRILNAEEDLKQPYLSCAVDLVNANVSLMVDIFSDPNGDIKAKIQTATDSVNEAIEIFNL